MSSQRPARKPLKHSQRLQKVRLEIYTRKTGHLIRQKKEYLTKFLINK